MQSGSCRQGVPLSHYGTPRSKIGDVGNSLKISTRVLQSANNGTTEEENNKLTNEVLFLKYLIVSLILVCPDIHTVQHSRTTLRMRWSVLSVVGHVILFLSPVWHAWLPPAAPPFPSGVSYSLKQSSNPNFFDLPQILPPVQWLFPFCWERTPAELILGLEILKPCRLHDKIPEKNRVIHNLSQLSKIETKMQDREGGKLNYKRIGRHSPELAASQFAKNDHVIWVMREQLEANS